MPAKKTVKAAEKETEVKVEKKPAAKKSSKAKKSAEKEDNAEDKDEVDVDLSMDDFFTEDDDLAEDDMLKNRPHNNHHDDPASVVNEVEDNVDGHSSSPSDCYEIRFTLIILCFFNRILILIVYILLIIEFCRNHVAVSNQLTTE